MGLEDNDFDWVKARSDCDAAKLFSDLREAVRSNCQSAKERADKRTVLEGIVFEHEPSSTKFSVARRKDSRIFLLSGDCIRVINRAGVQLHKATAVLVEDSCLLESGSDLLKPSQFSRLVLEDFFFIPQK